MTTREASNVTALENTHKGTGGLDHGKNAILGGKKTPCSHERAGTNTLFGLGPAGVYGDTRPGPDYDTERNIKRNNKAGVSFRARGSLRFAENRSHLERAGAASGQSVPGDA